MLDQDTVRRKKEAQIEQLLKMTRGDIGRAKRTGWYTGAWNDGDVDRVVARLRGETLPTKTSMPVVTLPGPPPVPMPVVEPTGPPPVPMPNLVYDEERYDLPHPRLTARQYDVLRHLVRGQDNRAIAEALFLSEDTVKSHLKAVLRAVGAKDRTQAVVAVLTCAVIPYVDEREPADLDELFEPKVTNDRPPVSPREQSERARLLAELAAQSA